MDALPPLPDSLPTVQRRLVMDIVTRLIAVRGVSAIALGGSHATGAAGAQSDIDMSVYYPEIAPFSIEEIRRVAHTVAPHSHPTVTGFHEWGPWVNGGVWLTVGDTKVDLLYRNIDQVEHTIIEAVSGVWHHDFDQQPTFGFRSVIYLAEIMSGLPLYDPHHRLAALRHQVERYPGALKYTIISDSLWSAEFTLQFARDFARKQDVYNTVGCLTRIASSLTQALFALNETYFLNDKQALGVLDNFTQVPARYRSRVEETLARPGRTADELSASVEAFESLWRDVTALAADSYKPKFRSA
jgi:Domain of unknown function (DUF4037)/Nucleotidyltransferase domain